jgi:hypothetical protein
MWHSFLYLESSYVWDLILAHIWFAPGFVLKSRWDKRSVNGLLASSHVSLHYVNLGNRFYWRIVLKCYELRTRQHKNRLMVNVLCPSKHYFPKDIMIFGRRLWRTYLHHHSINQWKTKHTKHEKITWIIIWHHNVYFITWLWMSKNSIELHLYLQLDRR